MALSCFPKPLKDSDDEIEDRPAKAPAPRSQSQIATRNQQYDAVVQNIRAHNLKLRLIAFRRRSLLRKPGLNENLKLWLSIEVGELASFEEKELRRVVSENVQLTTPDGESILHLAAQRGSTQVLRFAIKALPREKRASFINARSIINEPPLLLAAGGGHREAVRVLLRAGADVNITNMSGETALYLACYHGFKEVTKELLRHPKVDVERLSEEAASAYGVCLVKRHFDLARMDTNLRRQCTRLLWVARRKNSLPKCPLSSAPDSFIKGVISALIYSEVAQLTEVRR